MPSGSVLVIDDDEWVGRLLAVALREAGYEVHISVGAVEGYEKAVEMAPDCIICDVDLPDVDGFWVARKIRMAPDKVSVTPFLFLSGLDDRDTRLQGFHVGADVYMTKPFRIDEVVAQVGALVQMASRLRQSRKTFLSIPPTEAAMQGDLAQMSVATVLTLLDMERRSGKLEVSSKEQKALLSIVSGAIAGASLGGSPREPLELLRTLLTWNVGRFAFHPDTSEAAPPHEASINALLMEAVRLEDELRESKDALQADSSRRSSRVARLVSNAPGAGSTSAAPPQGPTIPPEALSPKLPDIERGWSEPPPPMKPSGAAAIATPPPAPTPKPAPPAPTAPKALPAKPGLVPPGPPGQAKPPFKPFGNRGSGAFPATPTPKPPPPDETSAVKPATPAKPSAPTAPQAPGPARGAPVRAPSPPKPRVGQGSGDK